MVISNRFPGGLFGESREKKQWAAEIDGRGWTDDKGEPDQLQKWSNEKGLDCVVSGTQTFAWSRGWFNPLEYSTAPGEHDPKRVLVSVLLGFSHPRPSIDLQRVLSEMLKINPLSVREALIEYWKSAEIVVDVKNETIQAGPKLLANLGNIEDIIAGSAMPMSVTIILGAFGDTSAPIPHRKGRINRHGVIVDMKALELNEDWLYERVRVEGPVIGYMDLAKSEPLYLDQVEGVNLSDNEMLEIVGAVCAELSEMFPEADIESDETIMRVGNSKEVADAFIRKLERIRDEVNSVVDEKKNRMTFLNDLRKSEEQIRRKDRLESRNIDSEERKLAIRGAVLRQLEQGLMDKGI